MVTVCCKVNQFTSLPKALMRCLYSYRKNRNTFSPKMSASYCEMWWLFDRNLTGMVTSGCLPIFAYSEFHGATCIDIPLDTLFSPIIDFRLGQLSYAFLIDSRGRVLLHPLLPKLATYKEDPIFLDMESVEISDETPVIKRSMTR